MLLRGVIFALALSVISVRGDDTVVLKNGKSEVTIHYHGATITSWKVDGNEHLFMGGRAKLDGSKDIMGGVPIIFPKFADWGPDRPFHGFARDQNWSLVKTEEDRAVFKLCDNEATRSFWNFKFCLEYTVIVSPTELKSNLVIRNPSESEKITFEVLYHTYLRVTDVRNITISGLQGLTYVDKTKSGIYVTESRELVTIGNITDYIYESTPNKHCITGGVDGKTIELTKTGLPDLVVWNPWSEEIKTFDDLKPDDWTNFVCAEAGNVVTPIHLSPGASYEASQTLKLL